MYKKAATPLILAMVTVALVACGGGDKKAPSQVLARVNSSEITVSQLNFRLASQKDPSPEVKQRALDFLVEEELLVQKAHDLKLDREQDVQQQLEEARRTVLARAAMRSLATSLKGSESIDSKKIDEFYQAHATLFQNRKSYHFTAFNLARSDYTDDLIKALNGAKSAQDTEALFKSRNIKYESSVVDLATEQLPPALVSKFDSMNVGDVLPRNEQDSVILLQFASKADAPLSRQDAEPLIRRQLSSQMGQKLEHSVVDSLKSGAKIEYLQRFVPASGAVASPTANSLDVGVK